jgi:hypothetical protein
VQCFERLFMIMVRRSYICISPKEHKGGEREKTRQKETCKKLKHRFFSVRVLPFRFALFFGTCQILMVESVFDCRLPELPWARCCIRSRKGCYSIEHQERDLSLERSTRGSATLGRYSEFGIRASLKFERKICTGEERTSETSWVGLKTGLPQYEGNLARMTYNSKLVEPSPAMRSPTLGAVVRPQSNVQHWHQRQDTIFNIAAANGRADSEVCALEAWRAGAGAGGGSGLADDGESLRLAFSRRLS